jgi:putative transcriptional regulator
MTQHLARKSESETVTTSVSQKTFFFPSFSSLAHPSAALVNQEHVHRLTGGTNHVVSAFDRRQRRHKSPVNAADWAHRLPEAETGCLLLAPEHEEGWWRHSVVLVLNHDDEGSTGVILNRPTNALLHRVVPEIDYEAPHHAVLADRRVSMGGPMGTEKGSRCLVALSAQPLEGATSEVFPGLWHVSDFAAVKTEHEKHLSVFVGYCGWVEGQLDAEVRAGGWLVAAASAANTLGLVSTAPGGDLLGESAWESLRARLGENSDNAARG